MNSSKEPSLFPELDDVFNKLVFPDDSQVYNFDMKDMENVSTNIYKHKLTNRLVQINKPNFYKPNVFDKFRLNVDNKSEFAMTIIEDIKGALKAFAKCNSPNILHIYGAGIMKEYYKEPVFEDHNIVSYAPGKREAFILMESMEDMISVTSLCPIFKLLLGHFPENVLGWIVVQTLQAIEDSQSYISADGIHNYIHSDIDPEKLYINHNGTVKLHDIGYLTENIVNPNAPESIRVVRYYGTTYYLNFLNWPPDKWNSIDGTIQYNIKDDIWALGITMFTCIAQGNFSDKLHFGKLSKFSKKGLNGSLYGGSELIESRFGLFYSPKDINYNNIPRIIEQYKGSYSDECVKFLLLCLTLDSDKRADIKRLKETQYYQRYAKDVYENQEVITQFFHEHQIFNQIYREQIKQYKHAIYCLTKKDVRFNMTALEGKLIFPQDNKIYDFSMKDMEEIKGRVVTRNVVQKSKHKLSGIFLAIKKIKLPEVFSSHDQIKQEEKTQRKLDRFRSEVKALFILSFSPYIVYYYGFTTLDGYLLIGMELMDTDLMEFYCFVHKRDGRFPETLLGTVIVSIIEALNYCSEKNILHRDIKPLNILLNKEGCIKLADFGESRFLDPMSLAKTGCGTIIYWPPERLTMESVEKGYDECSDVWSLGITLAEVAKGGIPYENRDGFTPSDLIDLQECIKNIDANNLIERCFDEHYTAVVKDFVKLCLARYENRPSCRDLTREKFYLGAKIFKEDIAKIVLDIVTHAE